MKKRLRAIGILIMIASFAWVTYEYQMYHPEGVTPAQGKAMLMGLTGLVMYLVGGGMDD